MKESSLFKRVYTYTFEYFFSSRVYDKDFYEENKFDMIVESKLNCLKKEFQSKMFTSTIEMNLSDSNLLVDRFDFLHLITIGKFTKDKSENENIECSILFKDFFDFINNYDTTKGEFIYWSLIKYPTSVSNVITCN